MVVLMCRLYQKDYKLNYDPNRAAEVCSFYMITLNWTILGSLNFVDLEIKQIGELTAPGGNRWIKR